MSGSDPRTTISIKWRTLSLVSCADNTCSLACLRTGKKKSKRDLGHASQSCSYLSVTLIVVKARYLAGAAAASIAIGMNSFVLLALSKLVSKERFTIRRVA